MTDDYRDGNALAGPLGDIFAVDITVTVASCAGCRRSDRIAALRVYDAGPGLIARCPECGYEMLRYAETPYGRWLDLRGIAVLRLDPATAG